MSEQAPHAPEAVDMDTPNAARMYDWYLGGNSNYGVDREFGKRVETVWPHIKPVALDNRAFLRRVVLAAREVGIRQFIDIGSGIPAVGNVHELVRGTPPYTADDPHVVYVDYEHVAASSGRMILTEQDADSWAGLVQQDMRDPRVVIDDPITERLIDWSQPVCVLMVAVLHFVGPDDDVPGLLGAYREKLAPGSQLAITHIACDDAPEDGAAEVRDFADAYKDTSNPLWLRDRAEVTGWFDGLDLLAPGVVHLPDWRPDTDVISERSRAARPYAWCGVGAVPKA